MTETPHRDAPAPSSSRGPPRGWSQSPSHGAAVDSAATRPAARPHHVHRVGRAARNVEIARLGTNAAGNLAVTRARQVFASAERRDEFRP